MTRPPGPTAEDPLETSSPIVTSEIAAEAAVWVTRLHGPDRSPRMERECLAWQARSAAHRLAFERCTDTWQDVAGLTLADAYTAMASQRLEADGARSRFGSGGARWIPALVIAGVLCLSVLLVQLWRGVGVYETDVGGQQIVVLKDGSRMTLNTDSRVHVDMGAARRTVSIDRGEALFEVAKDPQRPFAVRAGGSEVLAVGTVFSVRVDARPVHADDAVAVTLIEGLITVQRTAGPLAEGLAPAGPVAMQAGQRIRLARAPGNATAATSQTLDRPRIDEVMAWRRSEAVFDDVSLADAVAEMNRYDRTPIALVGDGSLVTLRVSGSYRTGDNAGFARAVATLHGLIVREHEGRLELSASQ